MIDIPKSWRHTSEGIWHKPAKYMLWTTPKKKRKNLYKVWVKYFESTCKRCGERFVQAFRPGVFCTKDCSAKSLKKFGKDHPRWNNGRAETASGYVMIRVGYKKYIGEHVLNIEKKLGRKLKKGVEVVHHKNGVRGDNRLSNLVVMTRAEHASHHHRGVTRRQGQPRTGVFPINRQS